MLDGRSSGMSLAVSKVVSPHTRFERPRRGSQYPPAVAVVLMPSDGLVVEAAVVPTELFLQGLDVGHAGVDDLQLLFDKRCTFFFLDVNENNCTTPTTQG